MTMTDMDVTPDALTQVAPDTAATDVAPGCARLEMKLVGEINGSFVVARYQRGYRWGKFEVERLLDDIFDSNGSQYSLQPIVVKRRATDDKWELVDGQQRLTTLYLIFLCMERERYRYATPPYTLTYETRQDCDRYLQDLDPALSDSNIDFFHIYAAYRTIKTWFERKGMNDGVINMGRLRHNVDKIHRYFHESVRVIWYEAHNVDSTDLFTRLNVGRIPLTDAELVKALLFTESRGRDGLPDRVPEMAAQWDGIERDLRNPDVWAFITDADTDNNPTRISILLDTLAGGPMGRERPRFHTFDTLRQKIAQTSAELVWNQILEMHALVLGWFEDRDLYHKIGYLVAVKHHFGELVETAKDKTKSQFQAMLDELIRKTLELSPFGVKGLSYENDVDKEKCGRLLLLMNVETVRRVEHSTERYSFRLHGEGAWSLEHIHAQNAETLTKTEQWKEWLRLHHEALIGVSSGDLAQRDDLTNRIDAISNNVDRNSFHTLERDVVAFFSENEVSDIHSIANLALISCGDNSALGNAVFEVKRRLIIERDKKGDYIPICTRNVFLKYYTSSDAHQIHFWGPQDRKSYLSAMISPESGIIFPYLRQEEIPS